MMNKVMAAAMIMAVIFAMPAMAGNKKNHNRKNDKVVVVINKDKKVPHFDRADKRTSRFAAHRHVYRPDVKVCTFRVSRHAAHHHAVAKAEHMKGVMNTKWNPRTRELTVIYDARVTSARHIMHSVA